MRFGLPIDPAQWLALALAPLALAFAPRLFALAARPGAARRAVLAATALVASALSAAYVAAYLRGAPRIIDATAYWLEARAIAGGRFAWPLHEPENAVLGRFLVRAVGPAGPTAAVIFPPGWPAVLSLGFRLGAPLVVGPVIAALLVLATADLAARVARSLELDEPQRARLVVAAAMLSALCAALRYHTADTMSHGLAALCFAAAIAMALRALDARPGSAGAIAWAAGAGLAAGWLAATRPPSALALVAVAIAALVLGWRRRRGAGATADSPRAGALAAAAIAGALPGLLLLALYERAATGALGTSAQSLYYAVGDGPPGCFRYGFGEGVGCVGEHGDFVRDNLARGYGALAAAGTTLRRLKLHLVDGANVEPLALLVPVGVWVGRTSGRVRLLAAAIAAQIAAYAPFYFDGNYPGGGARFFADVLPLEHVLLAVAAVGLTRSRAGEQRPRFDPAAALVAAALLGFAVRAGFDHAALRDRDGGAPMLDPAIAAAGGVDGRLLFVDTDHGFALGFDPTPGEGKPGVVRFHGDALDRLAWEARGRPPAARYLLEPSPGGGPMRASVVPIELAPAAPIASIEAESLWPARRQLDAWALPEHASGTCASGGRWLAVHAARPEADARVTVGLPARALAGASIAPRVALGAGCRGELRLVADGEIAARWALAHDPGGELQCVDLEPRRVPGTAADLTVELTLAAADRAGGESPHPCALDRLDVVGLR